jgi:hypothetical protein
MPYVRCQHCGLTSFSVAQWSSVETEAPARLHGVPGWNAAVDRLDGSAVQRD